MQLKVLQGSFICNLIICWPIQKWLFTLHILQAQNFYLFKFKWVHSKHDLYVLLSQTLLLSHAPNEKLLMLKDDFADGSFSP